MSQENDIPQISSNDRTSMLMCEFPFIDLDDLVRMDEAIWCELQRRSPGIARAPDGKIIIPSEQGDIHFFELFLIFAGCEPLCICNFCSNGRTVGFSYLNTNRDFPPAIEAHKGTVTRFVEDLTWCIEHRLTRCGRREMDELFGTSIAEGAEAYKILNLSWYSPMMKNNEAFSLRLCQRAQIPYESDMKEVRRLAKQNERTSDLWFKTNGHPSEANRDDSHAETSAGNP